MSDRFAVRPRLAPPLPDGYEAPATPGLNPNDATLDSRNNVKPPVKDDPQSGFARLDVANDFQNNDQSGLRILDERCAYAIVTAPGALDIDNFSYFIIRSVAGSNFGISLPTPTNDADPVTGDPIRTARGITIDIEYTGTGKPAFSGVAYPDNAEPDWTSTAGCVDTVVLTWAERWLLRKASFGYVP